MYNICKYTCLKHDEEIKMENIMKAYIQRTQYIRNKSTQLQMRHASIK